MLSPYRVLDLTTGDAALGPLILADLGADVIKIEPPGGLPERTDLRHPGGARFAAYNQNKRSAALDLDSGDGRERLFRLVAEADFLFENDKPGAMAVRGLGFDALSAANGRLIYVATTPFGQEGPYACHAASDLTLAAMGGMMAINGDEDRPPLRLSVPQAWRHGAAESAIAALVAHRRMLQTGEAQFVDVSVQAAVFWTLMNAMSAASIQGSDFERNGGSARFGHAVVPLLYACNDGDAVLSLGMLGSLPILVPLMARSGVIPGAWLDDEDWETYVDRVRSGRPVVHELAQVVESVRHYVGRLSRRSLLETGLAAGASFVPVNSIAETLAFDHLEARRFWEILDPGGMESPVTHVPGPFVRFRSSPIQRDRGVPKPGEHTDAVLDEVGVKVTGVRSSSTAESWLRGETPASQPAGALPFSGLKVADFSWVAVGPMAARYLADHGATTVHIESAKYPDVLRRGMPFKDGIAGINRSQYFGSFNTSKWSLAVDLKHPAGKAIGLRLLAWADVCLESFTPGTMAKLGLDYTVARAVNPRIVWASTCLMGQTGPLASLAGFGYHAAAMAGFTSLSGWPDRGPCNLFSPYTDTIANRFLAVSLMAAVEHARLSGQGEYMEQSQMESAIHFLTPEMLECQRSGVAPSRRGNDSPAAAPHNAYPCLGTDQWCAIAIETDEQWRSLRGVVGDPDWARAAALASATGRLARRVEIDARLGAWTRQRERYALMDELQAAGVPAGAVQRSSDLRRDPQLAHRGFFRTHEHAEMGEVPYEGHQFRIWGYDSGPRWASPALGEHSFQVMSELLGMSDDEIAEAVSSGALV